MPLLHLHTAQDLGDEGRFQIDRVTGLNRWIWHPVQRHRSARIFEEDPVALVGGRASGAEKAKENEENEGLRGGFAGNDGAGKIIGTSESTTDDRSSPGQSAGTAKTLTGFPAT